MVAGVAASAGLLMIGTMAAAARQPTPAPSPVVERVIVIETPAQPANGAATNGGAAGGTNASNAEGGPLSNSQQVGAPGAPPPVSATAVAGCVRIN